ncbi:SDR family oxidoreductase [Pelagibacterium lacus]|uniref:SDR family NAD(P)-dependent oxidoreductase n=1 Tax=Pelagibacterium lacus TaxID=2282655 RepID=A0A369W6R3_9HYPH|nr:SDR family oxidoreductase [Pelagibacterium lacus]RDE09545.1 SDR family NAD(P)-dependent oxidoreductase [Pelagibacterium lacus]
MSTVLITGGNRGIGLELARQYSAEGWTVLATARQPEQAEALATLGAQVSIVPLEASDGASIQALAANLRGVPIDVLIANAGISGDLKAAAQAVSRDDFLNVMAVNVIGPLLLARALKPNVLLGQRRVVAAMSSLMSSISANDWGTQYAYRASKTALNAIWRTLAREWGADGLCCVLLRPGLVATDMTGGAGQPVQASVAGMRQVIEGLSLKDRGRLIGFDGQDVPW